MMNVTMRNIAELIPYERNQKKHDAKQVRNIANSLKRFGWVQPIVVDKKDVVIIGHGRLMAAKMLAEEDSEYQIAPVLSVEDLTEDEVRELRIADNKLNESPWEIDFLKEDLQELNFDGFDFDFDLSTADILDVENEENINDNDANKTADVEELINSAWREHAKQFAEQYDILQQKGYTFSGITKALAKIKFIESKYYGKEYPRYLSLAFHKHQFITNGDNESAYEGLLHVADGNINPERLRFVTGDDITKITKGSLSFAGARMPLDFPASLARDLIEEFGNNGNILDPCHGWGGRLIGALLADVHSYTGVDPSELQNEGVKNIYETFKQYSKTNQVRIINSPFEDAEIESDYYDFALTSPPYFDTEHYIGGAQSHERYNNYELWRDGFYKSLIQKVYNSLKDGRYFALQVGSQRYPLAEDGKRIAQEIGFDFVEKRSTNITNNFNETDESHAEIVLIFKK